MLDTSGIGQRLNDQDLAFWSSTIGGTVAAATGDKGDLQQNFGTGQTTAQNAVENNYLTQRERTLLAQSERDCTASGFKDSSACGSAAALVRKDELSSQLMADATVKCTGAECNDVSRYIEKELNRLGCKAPYNCPDQMTLLTYWRVSQEKAQGMAPGAVELEFLSYALDAKAVYDLTRFGVRLAAGSSAKGSLAALDELSSVNTARVANNFFRDGNAATETGSYFAPNINTTRIIESYNPITNAGPLPEAIANTFRSGTYTEVITTKPTTLYRVYGGTANELGGYWTTSPPLGPVQSIIDSALLPEWGNSATRVVKIEVPAGVHLYQGQTARQGGLVGGGNQTLLPIDVKIDPSWIKK